MLIVENLRVSYGQIVAVHDLSFRLPAQGTLALLGANGAGKTSVVEAIVGLAPTNSGRVTFDGWVATGKQTSEIVSRGLTLVPQWRELFPAFTVEETLLAGSAASGGRTPMSLDEIYSFFPALAERRRQHAASLSGGEQQMLAIGRALMSRPRALLLDEPSAGLAVGIVRNMIRVFERIRETSTSLLLVEQNLEIAQALTKQCVVLAAGRPVWTGPITDAANLDEVRRAYFA